LANIGLFICKKLNKQANITRVFLLILVIFGIPNFLGRSLQYAKPALHSFISLFLTVWLTACTYTPPTFKIGLIAPFEGHDRALGYEALFATKLALQEWNSAGGINGYQIELVALNDSNDPVEARRQAKALLADPDVLGVVGHFSSEATEAVVPIYQESGLAVSVPWSFNHQSQERGIVSVAATENETQNRLDLIKQSLGISRVPKTSAFQIQANGIQAGEIIATLRESGFLQPIFGQVNTGNPQIIQIAGNAANGFIFVSPGPAISDIPNAGQFAEAYQSLSGLSPSPRAVLTYDATNILLEAIKQAMLIVQNYPATRSMVRDIINDVEWQGLSGTIVFDEQGKRIDAPVWIYQISDTSYPGTKFRLKGF
jgi:ABC-type branched-subunit amino acid transport system substrate-binding protein